MEQLKLKLISTHQASLFNKIIVLILLCLAGCTTMKEYEFVEGKKVQIYESKCRGMLGSECKSPKGGELKVGSVWPSEIIVR